MTPLLVNFGVVSQFENSGRWLESFAILTTEPNEIMAPIHNRMSVSRCSILRETLES
jgi:putative SOS response-associated peptidase YedK